jgi:hypothetical protein
MYCKIWQYKLFWEQSMLFFNWDSCFFFYGAPFIPNLHRGLTRLLYAEWSITRLLGIRERWKCGDLDEVVSCCWGEGRSPRIKAKGRLFKLKDSEDVPSEGHTCRMQTSCSSMTTMVWTNLWTRALTSKRPYKCYITDSSHHQHLHILRISISHVTSNSSTFSEYERYPLYD